MSDAQRALDGPRVIDWRCSYIARALNQVCCLPKGHTEPHELVPAADVK